MKKEIIKKIIQEKIYYNNNFGSLSDLISILKAKIKEDQIKTIKIKSLQ